jgi:hypothetical protein
MLLLLLLLLLLPLLLALLLLLLLLLLLHQVHTVLTAPARRCLSTAQLIAQLQVEASRAGGRHCA